MNNWEYSLSKKSPGSKGERRLVIKKVGNNTSDIDPLLTRISITDNSTNAVSIILTLDEALQVAEKLQEIARKGVRS